MISNIPNMSSMMKASFLNELSKNGSLLGRHRPNDGPSSRFFGLGKVFKTARPVSICRSDKIDTGSPAVCQCTNLVSTTDWHRPCCREHFPKSEKSWTRPVFWSMATQHRTIIKQWKWDQSNGTSCRYQKSMPMEFHYFLTFHILQAFLLTKHTGLIIAINNFKSNFLVFLAKYWAFRITVTNISDIFFMKW